MAATAGSELAGSIELREPLNKEQHEPSSMHEHALQVMHIDLARDTVQEMRRAAKAGTPMSIGFGKHLMLRYGRTTKALRARPPKFTEEMYWQNESKDNTSKHFMTHGGPVTHHLVQEGKPEARPAASKSTEEAAKRMREKYAALEQEKQANQMTMRDAAIDPLKARKLKVNHRVQPVSRSPALNSRSTSAYQPSPSLSATNATCSADSRAQRFALIHLLAIEPATKSAIQQKTRIPPDTLQTLLNSLADTSHPNSRPEYSLSTRRFRDLDPWAFPYHSQDRDKVLKASIKAFDRLRLDPTDRIWQRLLPVDQRGKGKSLSELRSFPTDHRKALGSLDGHQKGHVKPSANSSPPAQSDSEEMAKHRAAYKDMPANIKSDTARRMEYVDKFNAQQGKTTGKVSKARVSPSPKSPSMTAATPKAAKQRQAQVDKAMKKTEAEAAKAKKKAPVAKAKGKQGQALSSELVHSSDDDSLPQSEKSSKLNAKEAFAHKMDIEPKLGSNGAGSKRRTPPEPLDTQDTSPNKKVKPNARKSPRFKPSQPPAETSTASTAPTRPAKVPAASRDGSALKSSNPAGPGVSSPASRPSVSSYAHKPSETSGTAVPASKASAQPAEALTAGRGGSEVGTSHAAKARVSPLAARSSAVSLSGQPSEPSSGADAASKAPARPAKTPAALDDGSTGSSSHPAKPSPVPPAPGPSPSAASSAPQSSKNNNAESMDQSQPPMPPVPSSEALQRAQAALRDSVVGIPLPQARGDNNAPDLSTFDQDPPSSHAADLHLPPIPKKAVTLRYYEKYTKMYQTHEEQIAFMRARGKETMTHHNIQKMVNQNETLTIGREYIVDGMHRMLRRAAVLFHQPPDEVVKKTDEGRNGFCSPVLSWEEAEENSRKLLRGYQAWLGRYTDFLNHVGQWSVAEMKTLVTDLDAIKRDQLLILRAHALQFGEKDEGNLKDVKVHE